MSFPKNLLIFGATGQIGKYITQQIIKAQPAFNVSIFTSPATASGKPEYIGELKSKGVKVITGDVTKTEDVKKAYEGIDTVVSAVGRNVLETQIELIRLAEESSSVKWFFPSEYGTDIEYGPESANEKPHQLKLKVRKYIRENVSRLKHTYVVTGPYADMYFNLTASAAEAGGYSVADKKAVLVEDGEGKVGFTTMPDVGKAVVAALQHPEAAFNKALKVQSFVVTPNQILAEFEKQTSAKWETSYTPLETLREAEKKAWDEGKPNATIFTLRRIWSEGGTLYEKTDNESIGLRDSELETLEDAVKRELTTGPPASRPSSVGFTNPIPTAIMSSIQESPSSALPKPEKKSKKDKKEKKEKKRIREDDPELAEERKHKRSKSTAVKTEVHASPDLSASHNKAEEAATPSEKKKEKKEKKSKKEKKDKKDKHADPEDAAAEKKRRKKARHADEADADIEDPFAPPPSAQKDKRKRIAKEDSSDLGADDMDVDSPSQSTSKFRQPSDAPANPQYPFFTQTVSLFLPLYPVGWSEPCIAAATQHLKPMLSRYVPTLGGVLLAYRDVAVAENPGRKNAATETGGGCDVLSVDEYAVGFGWITAEVDLFIPKRGAWMEGTVNLESEGHIGVVCWGKFNASIESSRLPPEWHWVHLDSDEAMTGNDDAVSTFTADQEHGAVKQIHSTGYWADSDGRKIKGRVRFHIKSFDVGVSGDHGYLSLEGSLLTSKGEADALKRDNEEELRRRKGRSGGVLLKQRRKVPEFSMTKFGEVEDEEDKALRKDVWDTTEPEVAQGTTEGAEGFAGITHEEE
ncbi:hypothetical protein F5X68DRAFT_186249 [Plectosphaerella plurivora]|uniref:Uncharacterized protein n=1 Tax=Plectosphaerella plurivora TaxID=936078 RepID=A0A9P9AIE2_9PEZI|nr:hypothetical protein F5X68DRAFT_186249 [Plectosphaerella plurivora]